MSEVLFSRPQSTLSSGFVGTIICWCFGIGLTTLAVFIALNGDLTARLAGLSMLLSGAFVCGWARSANATWRIRLAAMLLGSTILLFAAEVILRNATNHPHPVAPRFVTHSSLGFVMDPNSVGIDRNGFHNASVPEHVDVVTIGDAPTAGLLVEIDETWPSVFAKQTEQSVYNLSAPGYGPVQYELLIKEALKLHPKQIIIGLNPHTDLFDVAEGISVPTTQPSAQETSIQRFVRGSAVASFARDSISNSMDPIAKKVRINHPKNPVYLTTEQMQKRAAALDLKDAGINKAFLNTIGVLQKASEQCRNSGAALTVLLIPSNAFVCCQSTPEETLPPAVHPMLQNEATVRHHLISKLTSGHVFVIDGLPAVRTAAMTQDGVFRQNDPQQPTAVVCEALATALNPSDSTLTN